MKTSLRNSAILLFCAVIFSVLCGCNGGAGRKGVVEIQYGTWEASPYTTKYINQVIADFEKLNPNIHVKLVPLGTPDKLLTELAGGDCQDVIFVHYLHLAEYITRGAPILPIDDLIKGDPDVKLDEYFKPMITGLTHNGKLYGLPIQTGGNGLYYNIDLFKKAGVALPNENWTIADMISAAQKLTRDTNGSGIINQHGLLQPDWQDAMQMCGVNNVNLFSADLKSIRIDSPEALAGMRLLSDLRNKYKVVTTDTGEMTDSGMQSFMTGRVAMVFCASWAMKQFRDIKSFKWDVTYCPLPDTGAKRTPPTASVMANCIWSGTKHKAEAYKFLKYFSSKAGLAAYSKSLNGIPPMKSLAYSKDFLPSPPAHAKIFLEGLDDQPVAPFFKNRQHIYDTIEYEMDQVEIGHETPENAAATLKREIDPMLQ